MKKISIFFGLVSDINKSIIMVIDAGCRGWPLPGGTP